jgi:hypothetical protein
MWDLWWTKWHWGKFSPSTSVSPANSHSTDCATFIIIIYHPGLVQQAKVVTDVARNPKKPKKKKLLKSLHTTLKVNWFILRDYEDTVSTIEVI